VATIAAGRGLVRPDAGARWVLVRLFGLWLAPLSADGIGRYSQEVETAIYFCCLEAMLNAAKHAPQAGAQARIWAESGGLLFSVNDDGPGFDPEKARSGRGFVNMADRFGAVGGTVRWESKPGQGSTISGSVPVI
jgi:signal transduction histidine kinase